MNKWLFSVALWLASAAQAHEFWMVPDRFSPPVRGEVELALRVGENFIGDPVGFGRPMAESLRWFSQAGEVQLAPQLPDNLEQDRVALAFRDQFKGRLLFAHSFGCWLKWDGARWCRAR
mgnify:CR=1 FL=1